MEIFSTPAAMRNWSDTQRAHGHRLGFVPTMGALHDGHLALISDAARRVDQVVVSIFVNPLQFNQSADFDGYPRPIDDDVAACRHAGVSAIFAPTAAAMYPAGFQTRVVPGALGDVMEGAQRPGHFEGVATVVAKLFGAVRPHVAIFGQKDYQQLCIIRQMTHDLDLGIDIVGHPIMRDADGLAMSSRNALLTSAQRRAAVAVPRALDAAVCAASNGGTVEHIIAAATDIFAAETHASLEYVTVFDASTLEAVGDDALAVHRPDTVRVATAAWFGDVRLIDNRDLFG